MDNYLLDYCELGIEYGNASGFYSANTSVNYKKKLAPHSRKQLLNSTYPLGTSTTIEDSTSLKNNSLNRATTFSFSDDSAIFDIVSRFVVWSDDRVARIGNDNITHRSSNLYYQHPSSNEAFVPIATKGYLRFRCMPAQNLKGFESVIYVRDEAIDTKGYRWVVHHRQIADPYQSKLVVRCCNPRLEGALPNQNLIPKWLKLMIFRLRERRFPHAPLMAVSEKVVRAGETAELNTCVTYINE